MLYGKTICAKAQGVGLVLTCLMGACSPRTATGPRAACTDFEAKNGTLEGTGSACIGFSARGLPGIGYWAGRYEYKKAPKSQNFEISVKFRRPAAESSFPVEIIFKGGNFAVSTGSFFFWETDAHWSGWQRTAAFDPNKENELKVRQRGKHVEGFINGLPAGTFEVSGDPASRPVGVLFKTKPDFPYQVHFRDFTVREF